MGLGPEGVGGLLFRLIKSACVWHLRLLCSLSRGAYSRMIIVSIILKICECLDYLLLWVDLGVFSYYCVSALGR
jgi:hypothetical protein